MSIHQASGNRNVNSIEATLRFTAGSASQSARRAAVKVNAAATNRVTAISIQRCRTSFLKM
jgi:hypothetical protein